MSCSNSSSNLLQSLLFCFPFYSFCFIPCFYIYCSGNNVAFFHPFPEQLAFSFESFLYCFRPPYDFLLPSFTNFLCVYYILGHFNHLDLEVFPFDFYVLSDFAYINLQIFFYFSVFCSFSRFTQNLYLSTFLCLLGGIMVNFARGGLYSESRDTDGILFTSLNFFCF